MVITQTFPVPYGTGPDNFMTVPKEDMGYFYETFFVKKRNPVYPDVYPSDRSFLWHPHYEDGFRRKGVPTVWADETGFHSAPSGRI